MIFYSDIVTPQINIKRIAEIKMGEDYEFYPGRKACSIGTYHLKFTVYYEKSK